MARRVGGDLRHRRMRGGFRQPAYRRGTIVAADSLCCPLASLHRLAGRLMAVGSALYPHLNWCCQPSDGAVTAATRGRASSTSGSKPINGGCPSHRWNGGTPWSFCTHRAAAPRALLSRLRPRGRPGFVFVPRTGGVGVQKVINHEHGFPLCLELPPQHASVSIDQPRWILFTVKDD